MHLWADLCNTAACNSWGWSALPRTTPFVLLLTMTVGGSPERLFKHRLWIFCDDLLGEQADNCLFHLHFWDQRKINNVIIKTAKQRQSSYQLPLFCALHFLPYIWAYMRHSRQGEVMESLLCSRSTVFSSWLILFHSGAERICALCTFLGRTLCSGCSHPQILVLPQISAILGESPFWFGLCFCFSWSCMTLHSFTKDKITDCAPWRLRELVHGDTVVLLMDKKGDFCELNLHTK